MLNELGFEVITYNACFYKIVIITVLLSFVALLFGCEYSSDPQQILVKTESITLAWDPPEFDARKIFKPINSYRVYFKKYGAGGWQMIAEVPADAKMEYTLHHYDFGDGMYEFAVNYILSDMTSSQLHTSHDHTAKPISGWYIWWISSD